MKGKIEIALILTVFVLACACDPGYRLHPKDWQAGADGKWKKQFVDFEIQTRGIGGLIGEWWIRPDLQIYNNTKSIYVVSAQLRTAAETFDAEIYDKHPIPPSTSGYHLPVKWTFEDKRAAPNVLGDQCELILNLQVNGKPDQLIIEYVK